MKSETTVELLPCPFCGEAVELRHTDHRDSTFWWVRCYCGIDAEGKYNDRQGVINHWNRRTTKQGEITV